jgi:hypothetical protein
MQMNGFSLLILLTSLPLVKGEREMLGQTPTKIHGRSVAVQSRLRGQTLLVGFEWTSCPREHGLQASRLRLPR